MATLLKVLNNLADIKSAGGLHFASEPRDGVPARLYLSLHSKSGAEGRLSGRPFCLANCDSGHSATRGIVFKLDSSTGVGGQEFPRCPITKGLELNCERGWRLNWPFTC